MAPPGWRCMEPGFFRERVMTEAGLSVTANLSVAFKATSPSAAMQRGNLLLLRVVNLYESGHETESNRSQERLEAKLDLMLHWLGHVLFDAEEPPIPQTVKLDSQGVRFPVLNDQKVGAGTLILYPQSTFAAPLKLPATLTTIEAGWARAQFDPLGDDLEEQWAQWLFRQHRRAIQSERR